MYDLIGDIHGHAEALVRLLKDLGYRERDGRFGLGGGSGCVYESWLSTWSGR